jgi:hypothetical protein
MEENDSNNKSNNSVTCLFRMRLTFMDSLCRSLFSLCTAFASALTNELLLYFFFFSSVARGLG